VEAILPAERNVAHRLIEEFMLLANETVARHLETHGMPALYRIHEPPDPVKVEEFEAFLAPLGLQLAGPERAVHPRDFQRLAERVRGRPVERAVALLMLRTMQKARYDAVNVGHFGLAAQTYTHFTSPIRRYPDLVVHRALRALRHQGVAATGSTSVDAMAEVGRQSSERERRAIEAERALLQWKKARFMAQRLGERFDGFVTGVAPFGLFVELVEHYVEGLVPVATMVDDFYQFSAAAHTLTGATNGRTYRLGDRVHVQVVGVDLRRRQVELGLAELLDAAGPVRRWSRTSTPGRTAARVATSRRPRGTGTDTGPATPSGPRRRAGRPGRRERAQRKASRGRR
jgi:ribonuclease R